MDELEKLLLVGIGGFLEGFGRKGFELAGQALGITRRSRRGECLDEASEAVNEASEAVDGCSQKVISEGKV